MENLKYRIDHDELLKWRHDGKAFCVRLMRDDCALSPVEDEPHVKLAFFGSKAHLGNDERTKGLQPLEYLVQLCREHVDPETAMALIETDRRLSGITLERLPDDLVTLKDVRNGDVFESVRPGAVIDVLADNLNFDRCAALLEDSVYYQPVWAYEHSGLTISTGVRKYPYNDQWDSYQVGYVLIDKTTVLKNWPGPEDGWRERAKTVVEDVVKTYDQYLTGDVWGYQLYELGSTARHENGEPDWKETDNVWGFFGDDMFKSGMADQIGCGFVDAFRANAVESDTAVIRTTTQVLLGAPPKQPATSTGESRGPGPDKDDGLRPFTVTVQKTGCMTVMARSADDAMQIADGADTGDVVWEDGWTPTDAEPDAE